MANKIRTLISKCEKLEKRLPKRAKIKLARLQLQRIANEISNKKSISKDKSKESSKQLSDTKGKKNSDPDNVGRFGAKLAQIEDKLDGMADKIKTVVLDEKEEKIKEKIVEKFELKEEIKKKSEKEPDNNALQEELDRAENDLQFEVDNLVRLEKGDSI